MTLSTNLKTFKDMYPYGHHRGCKWKRLQVKEVAKVVLTC